MTTAPKYNYVALGMLDVVHERPFTDVSLNADDRHSMVYIARRLHELLNGPEDIPVAPRPLQLALAGPNGRRLRIVLINVSALDSGRDLSLVGFFGQKRFNAARTVIDGVDVALQGEFPAFPEVVCYCTLQLEDGNFGNLVVLEDDAGREHWRESTHHQYAAADLAPNYYASLRLHNGVMRGGLKSEPDIHLVRTKYYDYQNGFWCGLRDLS